MGCCCLLNCFSFIDEYREVPIWCFRCCWCSVPFRCSVKCPKGLCFLILLGSAPSASSKVKSFRIEEEDRRILSVEPGAVLADEVPLLSRWLGESREKQIQFLCESDQLRQHWFPNVTEKVLFRYFLQEIQRSYEPATFRCEIVMSCYWLVWNWNYVQ
jgi:hypothetical protein